VAAVALLLLAGCSRPDPNRAVCDDYESALVPLTAALAATQDDPNTLSDPAVGVALTQVSQTLFGLSSRATPPVSDALQALATAMVQVATAPARDKKVWFQQLLVGRNRLTGLCAAIPRQ